MDYEGTVSHALRVMDRYPCPARVGAIGSDSWSIAQKYGQLIKMVARHVSATVPDLHPGCPVDCQCCIVLRRGFQSRDNTDLPPFYREMLDHLFRGDPLVLPRDLYEAAFRRELVGGGLPFAQHLNEPGVSVAITLSLLRGAGYSVTTE